MIEKVFKCYFYWLLLELIIVYIVGDEKDDGSVHGAINEGAQQGAATDACIETTVPKQGQNLWWELFFFFLVCFILFGLTYYILFFLKSSQHSYSPSCAFRFICDNPAELEELVESLHPQGVRESELKTKIQSRWMHYIITIRDN